MPHQFNKEQFLETQTQILQGMTQNIESLLKTVEALGAKDEHRKQGNIKKRKKAFEDHQANNSSRLHFTPEQALFSVSQEVSQVEFAEYHYKEGVFCCEEERCFANRCPLRIIVPNNKKVCVHC